MASFALLSILVLIFFLWLIRERKWKALLIIIVLLVVSVLFFFYQMSQAFRMKCDNHRTWTIEGYEIIEKRCLGFAGPPFYPVHLYKNGEHIDEIGFLFDSTCVIQYIPENGDTLTFNVCENKLE